MLVDRIIAQQRETAGPQRRPEGTMIFDPVEGPKNPPAPPLQHSPPTASTSASKEPVTSALKSSIDSLKNKILPPKSPFGSRPTPGISQTSSANAVRLLPDRSRTMTPTRDIGVCCCRFHARIILSMLMAERNMQLALSACRKDSTDRIESRSQMSSEFIIMHTPFPT
jgi:hypothetical protein